MRRSGIRRGREGEGKGVIAIRNEEGWWTNEGSIFLGAASK